MRRPRKILLVSIVALGSVLAAGCGDVSEPVVASDPGAEPAAGVGAAAAPPPEQSASDEIVANENTPALPPTLSPDATTTTAPGDVQTSTTVSLTVSPETTTTTTTSVETQSTAEVTTQVTEAPTDQTQPEPGPTDPTNPTDSPTGDDQPPITAPDEVLQNGEARSYTLLNELRGQSGVDTVTRDATMDAFARDWSRQMAETGRLEHSNGPYGENIAFTSNTGLSAAEAAELFHQLWADSPGHLANMTDDRYGRSGIGLYLTERGWYGTHAFDF